MNLSQPSFQILDIDANWFTQLWRLVSTIGDAGTTAQRPTKGLFIGRPYFDKTLNKPIWYDGTDWILADGTIV